MSRHHKLGGLAFPSSIGLSESDIGAPYFSLARLLIRLDQNNSI